MNSRRVLCMGDSLGLIGTPLPTLVKLLARAIANHLGDYAVVVDPAGTSQFYTSNSIMNLPPTVDMAAVEFEADIIWNTLTPRTVHYLVIDHASLSAFVGATSAYFDVVTPFTAYAFRFVPQPSNVTSWALPAGAGRTMPAVVLPANATGNYGPATFYAIDDGWNAPDPPERDSCRIRLSLAQVNDAASKALWADVEAATRATFERWARTVTWRRVGLSISGGGAAVFRLVPLFEALEAKQLPIDLIAGVSGGTIFAACYAMGGLSKVNDLANHGLSMSATFLGALVSSRLVSWYMNRFFDDCGVCNTEMRMLAFCTALPPVSPPQPTVVVDGTIGDAIRASGGAPFFAPYFAGDTRQSDGAVMAGLPPPFVAERFGADIMFAMNVLALPENRFPGETIPLVGDVLSLFYRYTPLGRLADTMSATSTMLHTISEGAGLHADGFVDAPPRDWAPLEQALFYNSSKYANEGLDGLSPTDLNNIADQFVLRWRALP